jgi:hypothetical protein
MRANMKGGVEAIEKDGILLTYPIDNRPEFPSLWSRFYPKSEMRWEWDESGDDRVANLWHLRMELSRSSKVVYAKWFRGRATFFSRAIFVDLLSALGTTRLSPRELGFGDEARLVLETLEMDSPLSTKQLKAATDLRGKAYERVYERAMRSLWDKLAIVGFGEVDDGAFPSLAVGATKNLFEDLWEEAQATDPAEAKERIEKKLGAESPFFRHFEKVMRPPARKLPRATHDFTSHS